MAAEPVGGIPLGRPRIAGISTHQVQSLADGWSFARAAPGAIRTPDELAAASLSWAAASAPCTVASAWRALGALPELDRIEDIDAVDWWFRHEFGSTVPGPGEEAWLRFEGLATIAEIWLNGDPIGRSENMFRPLAIDVSRQLRDRNELLIRFASLKKALDHRRPRPRWRTNLVEHQQLRWIRTTLLGRLPGWTPPVRAVGPWRPVRLERRAVLDVLEGDVLPTVRPEGPGLEAAIRVRSIGDVEILHADLACADHRGALSVQREVGSALITGWLATPSAELWWPLSHGSQPRYPATLSLATSAGPVLLQLGRVAFRSLELQWEDNGFRIAVNGVPVFARGACWTTTDIVSLHGSQEQVEQTLQLVNDAGMNMLRVGGTMVYEDARFFERCDELGILVWQDFMFANMDYPADDPEFAAQVEAEATEVLAHRRRFASLAVCCGGSEVEQQAAMLGLPAEDWSSRLFGEVLPGLHRACRVNAGYVRNSPTGGPLPFTVDQGVSHYYGVGAYLRPLEDARRAGVRFTSETLGFSNVPEPATVEALMAPGQAPPHHPRWKARVPRDSGPGWDFEDVRDHYLRLLFGVDPLRLRYTDLDRYLALSRVTTGEVMARTFAEWRAGTSCWGGLVWFLQDLWAGAGWGVVDSSAEPKAAWCFLRRAFASRTVFLTDEGLNGLAAHVINDSAEVLSAELRVGLLRDGRSSVATASRGVEVPPRSRVSLSVDSLLGRFTDLTWSYRFGPPGHDMVSAELWQAGADTPLARDLYFPLAPPSSVSGDVGLSGTVVAQTEEAIVLKLASERLAYAVRLEAGSWHAEDNYLHIPPSGTALVRLVGPSASRPTVIEALPLNASSRIRIRVTTEREGPA
jgi:beta-mannosidase